MAIISHYKYFLYYRGDSWKDIFFLFNSSYKYVVGCRGASQLGGSFLGIPPGYKANKL